ncbi:MULTISPECIES: hypothetical protein [Roseomonadaceae]|uniref:Glycosyl hydrolase-like 10 domain-containing protein n=1 Tax=Falsiroseomonas oleicola TaxID=2801474 RepID=A0ABS6HBZ1_9PROT|nr:hypothetical protein [Roseomonas oleicola]MBU8546247.1 hypothetical protein [Roseomonas oleicola]
MTPFPDRMLGITVMPEYLQTEGAEAVLDNLQHRAGATAIATSPYVLAQAPDGQGGREPPIDGGAGAVRLLDRPLWGRRELWVRTAPAFVPDTSLYRGLRYQPAEPDALTLAEGPRLTAAITAAKRRGLAVHLQVQAAIPPGYRVQFGGPLPEDRPRLPDGSEVPGRVDLNASLASDAVLDYQRALLRDLARAYPMVDAIRLDWPEYPPYAFRALFFDFSPPACDLARRLGFDLDSMRRDAQATLDDVASGAAAHALVAAMAGGATQAALRLFAARPGLLELARFKAAVTTRFLAALAETLHEASAGRIALIPQAFPPPFSFASGFDFAAVAPHVSAMGIKFYTMHWPMILHEWAGALGGAQDPRLLSALATALDLTDGPIDPARFRYPEPEEPHPVGLAAQSRKIAAARAAAGTTPVIAYSHGYGPPEDVAARFQTAWDASGGRVFVNRYGYLSNDKLDAIGQIGRTGGTSC